MELQCKEITKCYNNLTALSNFNLSMREGVWGLLGPNGAGKTTLMNIIASVLKPTKGEVIWNGTNIDELDANYRNIIGFLPQSPRFYNNFTARHFLKYMAALKGIEKKFVNDKIDMVLNQVNLSDNGGHRIGGFSGGMRRRLGIAQALLNDPKLIILDEPTAGLDPQERVRLRNLISTIAFERIVIWSTHIVSDIESLANRIIVLNGGHIILEGTLDELINIMIGKVWSLEVRHDEVEAHTRKFKISSIIPFDGHVKLRLISLYKPSEKAELLSPCLEDLYLFNFDDIGNIGNIGNKVGYS